MCVQIMRPPTRLDLTINHFIIVNADENVRLNLLVFLCLVWFWFSMLPSILMFYECIGGNALFSPWSPCYTLSRIGHFFDLHQEIAFQTL